MHLSIKKTVVLPSIKDASVKAKAVAIYCGLIARTSDADNDAVTISAGLRKNIGESHTEYSQRCAKTDFGRKNCSHQALKASCIQAAVQISIMGRDEMIDLLDDLKGSAVYDDDETDDLRSSLTKEVARAKISFSALTENSQESAQK